MALNIKNPEVEALIEALAASTGETKTEAVRRALEERKARLELVRPRRRTFDDAWAFLEREIWSALPPECLGRPPLTRAEEDAILGYDQDGT